MLFELDFDSLQTNAGKKIAVLLKPILPMLYRENRRSYFDVIYILFCDQFFINNDVVLKAKAPFSLYPNIGVNKSVNDIVNLIWS